MSAGPLPAPEARLVRGAVLFADVDGFGHISRERGVEVAYLTVTRCLRLLDGIARKHGGSVDKFLGDKLLAVFGHPVPREDASGAAVDAALEMRECVEDYNRQADVPLPVGFHAGVNTGDFVAGAAGGAEVLREFRVLGDAVNTAARFNAKASEGRILVGPLTWEETRERFVYRALEPMALKGKALPVRAYELLASRETHRGGTLGFDDRPLAPRAGRDEELARLRGHLERLRAGSGGVVRIEGEGGAGKSRLLRELGACEDLDKIDVIQARATRDGARPWATIARVLLAWARIEADAPAPKRHGRLSARLQAHHPEAEAARLAAVLGTAIEAGLPGADVRPPAPAEVREAVRHALVPPTFPRPVLVVVEDAQRSDPESLALLGEVIEAARGSPVLFVFTLRPDGAGAEPVRAAAGASCDVVHLGPLGPADARRLVESLTDGLDPETARLVLERGSGVPGQLTMASFLAPSLQWAAEIERRMASERPSQAERRRASVLFADITGFTSMTEKIGAEAAYPLVIGAIELLDRVAREHGGTVDKHQGDCVLALFGVPRAIEDAPRAAVNAAIDMRRRLREFNDERGLAYRLDVHTGIATGLGIAGDVSGPMMREFAVLGDHVDRADVLTHAASAGEIRVDAETHRATGDLFEYRDAERLDLPGGEGEQPTWDLLSTTPRLHRARIGAERRVFSPLVGRDAELGSLREKLAALARGEGGVVSLVAEAGVGKSRLMAELRGSDEARAVQWLEGRALSTGRNLSFHPLADMLRAWARIGDEDGAAEARTKLDLVVDAVVPDGSADIGPLLANLMGLPLGPEEQERLAGIPGDALEKLVRAALVRLLRAGSALRPVVVVMEDLHWADLSSVELLQSLLRLAEEHPILFVNGFRPGFDATSGRVLASARKEMAERHLELPLEPLGAEAARQLVKNLFRGGEVPQTTRRAIEERARGNPFYIEEVVRTLVQAGAVELRDGRFRATEKLGSVAIPGTVQEAVLARVDRLDLRRKSVLQAAAVVGGSFHLDVVAEMLGHPTDLGEILDGLQDDEFLTPSDRTAGVEFAFQHPLIQEVTYDTILETRREELHRDVARATERCLGEDVPGYFAMLAYHYSMGRDASRAEEFLFRAGDEAARVAASSEALQFFQQASDLYLQIHGDAADPAKRALLKKNVALALLNRGRLLDAVEHFDEATALLGARSPRRPAPMAAAFAGDLFRVLGSLYLPRPRRPAATPAEVELFDVMFKRAMAQSTTDPTRFFVDCMALLRRLSRVDPFTVPESAAMYAGVVAIFSYGGLSFRLGRSFLEMARELAEGGAVDERLLYYRTLRFLHHLLEGDWSDEHAVEPALLEEGLREGRFWELSTYLNLEGVKHVYRGDVARARERIRGLAELADLYEHDLAASAQHALTAYLHVERRELDDALRALELYYDEHAEPLFNLLALGTRAKVELLQGDADRAGVTLERAEALQRRAGRAPPYHASSVRSARQMLDVHLLEAARGSADRALRRRLARSRQAALASAARVAWRRPEALRLAAREAWLLGRETEALGLWEQAVHCCLRLGAAPERARTLAEAGAALAGCGERGADRRVAGRDAQACLREARAIFDELDLAFDRDRLDRVA